MPSTFRGITYKDWEHDFDRMMNEDYVYQWEREMIVELRIGEMKRKQLLFEGDRSHPQIVELDSMVFTFKGWQQCVKSAEQFYIDGYFEGEEFDMLSGCLSLLKQYQAEHDLKKRTPTAGIGKRQNVSSQVKATPTPPPSAMNAEIKSSQSEKDELEDDDDETCVICMESRRSHAFMPCGHLIICANCAWDPRLLSKAELRCPFCRAAFSKIIKMH